LLLIHKNWRSSQDLIQTAHQHLELQAFGPDLARSRRLHHMMSEDSAMAGYEGEHLRLQHCE
jgi:hypothetical protein